MSFKGRLRWFVINRQVNKLQKADVSVDDMMQAVGLVQMSWEIEKLTYRQQVLFFTLMRNMVLDYDDIPEQDIAQVFKMAAKYYKRLAEERAK